MTVPSLDAEALAKILLVQSLIGKLPSSSSIFGFVNRALEDLPGVRRATYQEANDDRPAEERENLFPVYLGNQRFGNIELDLDDPGAFSPYADFVRNICFMMAATIQELGRHQREEERQRELEKLVEARTEELARGLKEKEILLRELYHRTRNNMQLIASLMTLHASHTDHEELRDFVRLMINRIESLGLVHQKLYQSHDLSRLDLAEYVQELSTLAVINYQQAGVNASLEFDLKPVSVTIDQAIPLGLLINEILANALKYAFPEGRRGHILIRLQEGEDESLSLEVSDDGVGFGGDRTPSRDGSLGMQLIQSIAEYQLGGKVDIQSDSGVSVHVWIPKNDTGVRV